MHQYKSFVNHSITFYAEGTTGKHSWDDWRLVPTSRPVINPPAPKYNFIEIPGTSQEIDLSQVLTGSVEYGPREGQLEFVVINKENWATVYESIMNYLAGNRVRIVLDDDSGFYYEGRCFVSSWASEEFRSRIVIDYHLKPLKYTVSASLDNWEFDASTTITGAML